MKKLGRVYFFSIALLFIPFLWVVIQTFKPVRNVQPDDVMKIEGIVTEVTQGPGFDIVIKIKGDSHYYYINRGLQQSLNLSDLRNKILNKNVTIFGIERWTLFTQDGNMGHIAKLICHNEVLYTEIKKNTDE